MNRLISLILFLTMVVICSACATTTAQQRTDKESLSGSIGKSTFVGESSSHARDLSLGLMYGQ